MSIRGINITETVEFISKFDKGAKPTKFIIGSLTNAQKLDLMQGAMDKDGNVDANALQKKSLNIVKAGLKKIIDLEVKKDKKIEYITIENITDEVLDTIPMVVLTEVAGEIIKNNFLTEQEEKN